MNVYELIRFSRIGIPFLIRLFGLVKLQKNEIWFLKCLWLAFLVFAVPFLLKYVTKISTKTNHNFVHSRSFKQEKLSQFRSGTKRVKGNLTKKIFVNILHITTSMTFNATLDRLALFTFFQSFQFTSRTLNVETYFRTKKSSVRLISSIFRLLPIHSQFQFMKSDRKIVICLWKWPVCSSSDKNIKDIAVFGVQTPRCPEMMKLAQVYSWIKTFFFMKTLDFTDELD